MTLGVLTLAVVITSAARNSGIPVEGRLVKEPETYPWIVVSAAQIMSGTTIPADSHVVFHLPENFTRITRETLLGLKGKRVRYWGYCFPQNYDPKNVSKRRSFPGIIFLSEEERLAQEEAAANRKPRFTINRLPSEDEVREVMENPDKAIRHQLDIFKPGTMCYIMTEEELAIGLDPDGDRLNNKLETELGTNRQIPDSDGDGLIDGIEYIGGTIPSIRDTDADGIIDGIEDSNWNGRIDIGETDPLFLDSDRDNLCDGMCRVKLKKEFIYMGEDKNLNGEVDGGETDPRKWDTDGDGANDEIEYLKCIAEGKTECP